MNVHTYIHTNILFIHIKVELLHTRKKESKNKNKGTNIKRLVLVALFNKPKRVIIGCHYTPCFLFITTHLHIPHTVIISFFYSIVNNDPK